MGRLFFRWKCQNILCPRQNNGLIDGRYKKLFVPYTVSLYNVTKSGWNPNSEWGKKRGVK